MARIVGLFFLVLMVAKTNAQDPRIPYFQCGPIHQSYFPKIEVIANPIAFVDTARISSIIDGDTLGHAYYPRWAFKVKDHISGYCHDTIILPLKNEEDSLQFKEQVHLEMVRYEDTAFALLSPLETGNISIEYYNEKLAETDLFYGELLSIIVVSEEVDLVQFGIETHSGIAKAFGYDTASIIDRYYKLQFKTENDTQIINTRELKQNNAAQFKIGEFYLFQYYVQDDLLWIDNDILFRENYHSDEYFKAYEKRD
jgi:hypothetical protein